MLLNSFLGGQSCILCLVSEVHVNACGVEVLHPNVVPPAANVLASSLAMDLYHMYVFACLRKSTLTHGYAVYVS